MLTLLWLALAADITILVQSSQRWYLTGSALNDVLNITDFNGLESNFLFNENIDQLNVNDTSMFFGGAVAIYKGLNNTLADSLLLNIVNYECGSENGQIKVHRYDLCVSIDYQNPLDLQIGLFDSVM